MDGTGAPAARRLTLTLAEAADRIGVSKTTVRELIRSGRLPAVRLLPGGDLRVRAADVDTFVARLVPVYEDGLRLVYGPRRARG